MLHTSKETYELKVSHASWSYYDQTVRFYERTGNSLEVEGMNDANFTEFAAGGLYDTLGRHDAKSLSNSKISTYRLEQLRNRLNELIPAEVAV